METFLVTGASGYLGSQVVEELRRRQRSSPKNTFQIIALDVRPVSPENRKDGILYLQEDIRSPNLAGLFKKNNVTTVVHLASIVNPGKKSDRAFEYSVDVEGTANVLRACAEAGVGKIIVSSSGAAYGYHPDNPNRLTEDAPLRANEEFAYSWHKRLVEEMLAEYRKTHPQLKQVVFRIGTILGSSTQNQITAMFDKPRIIRIRHFVSPFVFVWDRDVVNCIVQAIFTEKTGIYNVAADGILTLLDIAGILDKKTVAVPLWLLRAIFWLLKKVRLTVYGPEQVAFLQYRPVLDNQRLKEEFGYQPQKTTREVFEYYCRHHGKIRQDRRLDSPPRVVIAEGNLLSHEGREK